MKAKLNDLTIEHLKTAYDILLAVKLGLFFEHKARGYSYKKISHSLKSLSDFLEYNLNSENNG